jgi:methylthioribulose-1-phosphate dehydratase
VTGTGGGITIKKDDLIYIAPSGVHKERVKVSDYDCEKLKFD